eukprot:gnl/Ergobibamus_cyprinoides/2020.p2 GENE.gnl/Ergobibamus_cyprinoides/2020~~gnl/Ergobibamus_cyprinoides/2020.p2  ORF type:complete len:205 (+),score=98.97 gnl/Ergobibamus_cyprinoides/2020:25-615(+)
MAPIVIDARAHLLGRLASVVAQELLAGNEVVIVRCEAINISGDFQVNKWKYLQFLRKRTNTNHKKGPFHFRAPSKIMFRTIRGMVPHKTSRGKAAMDHLKCFEGCPAPYDTVKRVVVPAALRTLRLKPHRKYCSLGRLSSEVGWKYADVVEKLEAKRCEKSAAFYESKKAKAAVVAKAAAAPEVAAISAQLATFGY